MTEFENSVGLALYPDLQVTLLPENFVATAKRNDTILDCLLDAGIDFPHECGGNCTCTSCAVKVVSGEHTLSNPENPEIQRLQDLEEHFRDAIELRQIRLACQALVKSGSVTVQKLESES